MATIVGPTMQMPARGHEATTIITEVPADENSSVVVVPPDAIAGAADNVVQAVENEATNDAAAVTADVKVALMESPALKGTSIDVETIPSRNMVTLSGTVRAWSQIQFAAQIAKKKAPGYRILNHLRVVPQSTLKRRRHKQRRKTHINNRRHATR